MGTAPGFMLCTPTFDNVKSRTIECVEAARWSLYQDGEIFPWTVTYGDGVARTRCIMATTLMMKAPEIPYLIFLDSDILFTPDNLKKLYADLVAGYDLIGGLFAVRGGTSLSSYDDGVDGKVHIDGKIQKWEYIASGFMGISQRLLKKMVEEIPLPMLHPKSIKFYPFFEDKQHPDRDGESIYLSEDYDFCEKARKVGVDSYVDTSIQLGHLGEYTFTLQTVLDNQAKADSKEEVARLQALEESGKDVYIKKQHNLGQKVEGEVNSKV